MVGSIDPSVNTVGIQTNPEAAEEDLAPGGPGAPARRRMGVAERERQIVDSAIAFFAEHGIDAQMRELARSIGVTHALLYHYFPTKQALVDRVYHEVFEGRWLPEWDALLDDPRLGVEDKLTGFYVGYLRTILSKEFVRILVFSGLTDHTITDRFFALLRERLFPRLIRETRRFRGVTSRARPTERELELLMGLHGGFFYVSMRHWIYGQRVHDEAQPREFGETLVRDRVRAYLSGSRELFDDHQAAARNGAGRNGAARRFEGFAPARARR